MTMFWWPPRNGEETPIAYDEDNGKVISFDEILRTTRYVCGESVSLYHDSGEPRGSIIMPRKADRETREAVKRVLPELVAVAEKRQAATEAERKKAARLDGEKAERLSKLPWMEVLRELLAMPQGELKDLLHEAEERKWSHYERKTSYGTRSDPSCGEWRRRILSIPIGAGRFMTVTWDWEIAASWYGRD